VTYHDDWHHAFPLVRELLAARGLVVQDYVVGGEEAAHAPGGMVSKSRLVDPATGRWVPWSWDAVADLRAFHGEKAMRELVEAAGDTVLGVLHPDPEPPPPYVDAGLPTPYPALVL
jgi:hypothetical protein